MSYIVYDFAIIGAGAAGLHLAQAMLEDEWFEDKKILILERDDKATDDRTWSYWEKGVGKWDDLIAKSWNTGLFNTRRQSIDLHLAPYQYKMLHSIDFYQYAKKRILKSKNQDWVKEEVKSVVPGTIVKIHGSKGIYQAKQVFDSRIDGDFKTARDKYFRVIQHFKGWVIETKDPVFDPDTFVMMDYRIKWKNSTSFTYILPTSPYSAMVEFTLFNLELIDDHEYDELLRKYINEILKIKDYTVVKTEYGIIPMSNYPFHRSNKEGITKIGTAGSWVKPSSGYAFKNIEKMAGKVVENLKHNRSPSKGLLTPRFRFYDTLYLDVFSNDNASGEFVFETMFTKNSIQQIFKFLDEETSFSEELKIMIGFDPRPFLNALLYNISGVRF